MTRPLPPGQSLLIRVDFTDDTVWETLREDAEKAYLTCVDDGQYSNLEIAEAVKLLEPRSVSYAFLADNVTMTNPDHPVLAFTKPGSPGQPGQTLRIVPAFIGTIADNLAIANLSLNDYVSAADDDGVFRGFIPPVGNITKAEVIAAAAQNTSTPVLAQFYEEAQTLHYVVATVSEVDLAKAHAQVSAGNYSMAEVVLGREDYLEACRVGGRAHGTSLPLPRGGYWSFLFDRATRRPLAAMKVQMPQPAP